MKSLKDPSCAIFLKGSRISNMTFPFDMVDMEMVHMDMEDMDRGAEYVSACQHC